jgi:hypothetical protein
MDGAEPSEAPRERVGARLTRPKGPVRAGIGSMRIDSECMHATRPFPSHPGVGRPQWSTDPAPTSLRARWAFARGDSLRGHHRRAPDVHRNVHPSDLDVHWRTSQATDQRTNIVVILIHACLNVLIHLQESAGMPLASRNTCTVVPVVNKSTTVPVLVSTSAVASRTSTPVIRLISRRIEPAESANNCR